MDINEIITQLQYWKKDAELRANVALTDTARCFWDGKRQGYRHTLEIIIEAKQAADKYYELLEELITTKTTKGE